MDHTTIGDTGMDDTIRPRDGRHRPIAGEADADADGGQQANRTDPMAGDQTGEHRAEEIDQNRQHPEADDPIGLPADDATSAKCGDNSRRQRGGQPNNVNRLTYGHRSVEDRRFGISSPRLPAKYRFIDHRCDVLRRAIEDAVRDRHGSIGVWHQSVIAEAVDAERARLYLAARLRDSDSPASLETSIRVMEVSRQCTERRTRCLDRLGIGDTEDDPQADFLRSLQDGGNQ